MVLEVGFRRTNSQTLGFDRVAGTFGPNSPRGLADFELLNSAATAGAAASIALQASPVAHQGEVSTFAASIALVTFQAGFTDLFEFHFGLGDDAGRDADRGAAGQTDGFAAQHLGRGCRCQ